TWINNVVPGFAVCLSGAPQAGRCGDGMAPIFAGSCSASRFAVDRRSVLYLNTPRLADDVVAVGDDVAAEREPVSVEVLKRIGKVGKLVPEIAFADAAKIYGGTVR